jgi:hypothetical protein
MARQLRANNGLTHRSKKHRHSITSAAQLSRFGNDSSKSNPITEVEI